MSHLRVFFLFIVSLGALLAFAPAAWAVPETTIDSGPAEGSTINTPTATFAFSSDTGVMFQCSVDGNAFAPCTSPYTTPALPDGQHNFAVRALDVLGVPDPAPAARNFIVETTPPETTLKMKPKDKAFEIVYHRPENEILNPDQKKIFSFKSSEPNSTFECRLDRPNVVGESFAPCTSPQKFTSSDFTIKKKGKKGAGKAYNPGKYTFEVAATDQFGNTDPTPAEKSFKVIFEVIP